MKTYVKIHILYPKPLSKEAIKEIDGYLPTKMRGRIVVDKNYNQVGTIVLELDELTEFLLALDGTDCETFSGYPKSDHSNFINITDTPVLDLKKQIVDCIVHGLAN